MRTDIHKFFLGGLHILLDINSGAVHVIDAVTDAVLDWFDGANDQEVMDRLAGRWGQDEVAESLTQLHELIEAGLLFAPPVTAPPDFDQPPIVKSLCLHIAHDCNLRCGYCFAGTGAFGGRRALMPPEVGRQAVDFLIAHSPRRHGEIDFFGGEPLLNMETVRQVVAYARQRERETGRIFKLTLTTNATVLNDDVIRFLNDNDISLVLSLDGRRQVHDRMRPYFGGQGSYDTVVANIRRVVASRQDPRYAARDVYTYVRGTYTAYNTDFAADVLHMVELGFDQLSVEPVVAKDAPYALREEHLPVLFQQYERLAEEYVARQLAGRGFNFFHFNLDLAHGPCLAKRLAGCGAGHEYYAVTPEGDLYPCHQFVGREEFRLGSVFTGLENLALARRFRQAHVLHKPTCRQCWARFYCSGGCHANAHLFNGTIDEPYRLGCALQKKRLECAIMVQAKLFLHRQGLAQEESNYSDNTDKNTGGASLK